MCAKLLRKEVMQVIKLPVVLRDIIAQTDAPACRRCAGIMARNGMFYFRCVVCGRVQSAVKTPRLGWMFRLRDRLNRDCGEPLVSLAEARARVPQLACDGSGLARFAVRNPRTREQRELLVVEGRELPPASGHQRSPYAEAIVTLAGELEVRSSQGKWALGPHSAFLHGVEAVYHFRAKGFWFGWRHVPRVRRQSHRSISG